MLRADYSRIENHKEVCSIPDPDNPDNRILNPVTEALSYLTMHVGMREITEDNAQEFFERVYVYEATRAPLLGTSEGPRPITPADVRAHVGMKANVQTYTKTQFHNHIMDLIREDAVELWRKVCPVTGIADCAERSCELHYMDAPLKLAPESDKYLD